VDVSAKSSKCPTKEFRRKGTEDTNGQSSAEGAKAAAAAKYIPRSTKAKGGDARDRVGAGKRETESVKYAKKIFAGRGSLQSQSNGQFDVH